jgi:hypothetical protein
LRVTASDVVEDKLAGLRQRERFEEGEKFPLARNGIDRTLKALDVFGRYRQNGCVRRDAHGSGAVIFPYELSSFHYDKNPESAWRPAPLPSLNIPRVSRRNALGAREDYSTNNLFRKTEIRAIGFSRQSEPAGLSGMETRIEKSGRTLGCFAPPTPPDFFYLNRL